ncbi:hypothetical protein N9Z15_02665 [Akkermansiaceae bacterium]|nr:hypothetical protein [Akkermansiaceae bacterium]
MKVSKIKTILTGALVVVAIIFKLYQGWDDKQLASRDGSITPAESGLFSDKFTSVKTSGAGLELLSKCRLITGRNGDGDSFHVKHEKGETEFRLYFVDTPESQYKTYGGVESNGKRLDQQAAYFGMSSRDEITKVGKEGKVFTKNILFKGDFKILTKWEDVVRPGRSYCLVIVEWEGKEVYLHELLVAQGLVRVHTRGCDMPHGRGWKEQRKYLEGWEEEVKAKGIGAWGM